MSRSASWNGTWWPNSVIAGPNGITANASSAGDHRGQAATRVDGPVGGDRRDALLEEELDAVGQRDEDRRTGRPGSARCASACRR